MINQTSRRAFTASLALFLSASTAFAGPIVELTSLPASAVVVGPAAGAAPMPAAITAALAAYPDISAKIASQGPLVVLTANGQTLLVPQSLATRAQALVLSSQAGAKPSLVTVTKTMAAALRQQLAQGDVAAAARTLNAQFDASKTAAAAPEAVAGTESAGAAPLAAPQTHAASSLKAPPAPKAEGKTWDKAQPLPTHEDRQSEFESADQAVEMHATHDYPGATSVDPAELLLQDAKDYIATKDLPNEKKHFIFKYFEIGDGPEGGPHSKAVQAVESLVKAGIKTTIITDINQSMEGVFPKDELHNADFESAKAKPNGPGRAMTYFKSLGFGWKYGEGKFTIVSGVPLFNPRDKGEKPLAHDKGYVAEGPDGKAWKVAGNGTANMNATEDSDRGSHGGRYNAVMRSFDRTSNTVDLEHSLGEIAAFNKRDKFAKDLDPKLNVPQRVNYGKSGEFREHAYTNGQQNPNDRIVDTLIRATKSLTDALANKTQPDFEISEIIFSHFVLTDTPEVDALRKYLDALRAMYPADYQKRVSIFGVFDQQFISPDGFGEAAALDGILVQRPMGKSIFPFRTEYMGMMKLYGYLRLLSGATKVNPDSAPTNVHLWHDKTTLIKTRENGVAWTYAWTRSLNNSGHFQSLESQDMYRLKPESKLAGQFEDRIKKVAAAEPQYALDLDKAIAMTVLAHFTGHTPYDDGMAAAAGKMIDAMTHMNLPTVKSTVEEIVALATKHVKQPDAPAISARVARFMTFLEKYGEARKADPSLSFLTYRKALNIMVSLAENSPWAMRTSLDLLLWKPGQTPDQQEAAMKKAWTEWLQMTEPFPEPKSNS